MARTLALGGLICVVSWVGLFIGAGNVGLQRSVAVGPLTLLEVPLAIALAGGVAFAAVFVGSRLMMRSPILLPLALTGAVLAGDLIGAMILAPLAVAEIEIVHAPVVLVVITAPGLQPVAAGVGAWLARSKAEQLW